MRWVGRLFALVGFLLFVAVGVVGFEAYLSITGRDLRLLNAVVTRFGNVVAGQRTRALRLEVGVDPEGGRLSGRAQLTVEPTRGGRQRFYFLLGDAFHLEGFAAAGYPQARAYKLWLITVVDLGRPAPAGETIAMTIEYEGKPETGLFGLGTAKLSPRDVQLSVDSFWFPNDLQGQFDADVAVTLPAYMTLVYAGEELERSTRGRMQRVRWHSARPVPSLSLVAGPYEMFEHKGDDGTYRVYIADDIRLDAEKILASASGANRFLGERYGASGYDHHSFFVSRRVRRAYNDGSGVIGLSIRYFRRGDYGFNVIAHELAHDWWGATVMEKWLEPATGGEWLVEGFAEFSSILAGEARFGREALVRRLAENFFDPRRNRAVGNMSVLDNAVGDDAAREIIYDKGSYIAMMLRRLLGDEALFPALRVFLERFRYQGASEADLEAVLQETTGQDLSAFFAQWVRSDKGLDLSLDANEGGGGLTLHNLGEITAIGDIEIDSDAEPAPPAEGELPMAEPDLAIGAQIAAKSGNVDPDLTWADMWRDDNVYPRQRFPLAFALSAHGRAQIDSEAFPWSAATLQTIGGDGAAVGKWELPSTVVSLPRWLDEHTLVLNTTDATQKWPSVVLFDTANGSSKTLGPGAQPMVQAGAIYAVEREAIVRWQSPKWEHEILVREKRHAFGGLAPSPDARQLAFASARDNDMEIKLVDLGTRRVRTLLHWDRDLRDLIWSADGSRIYAAIGGDWDWQVWEIPVDGGPLRQLAREAAAIGNLALSPDGKRLAFAAALQLDYPFNRKQAVILDLEKREVTIKPVAGSDVRQLGWRDESTLIGIAAPTGADSPFRLPEARDIVEIEVGN